VPEVNENALMHMRLGRWLKNPNKPSVFAWLSCTPTEQRVPGEFYALKVEVDKKEVEGKSWEEILSIVQWKLDIALGLMESFRVHPPDLKNPLTGEYTDAQHG
jgi:hypothetical protein